MFARGRHEDAAAYQNVNLVFLPTSAPGSARLVDAPQAGERTNLSFKAGVWSLNETFRGAHTVFDVETLRRDCRLAA